MWTQLCHLIFECFVAETRDLSVAVVPSRQLMTHKMEEKSDIFTLEDYMRGMKIPPEQVEVDFDQSRFQE